MSVKVIPKRNWLTIRRHKLEMTEGGIIIPGEKGFKYIVEDVSEDVDMNVEPGMEVFCPGQAVPCEAVGADKDLFMVQESGIIGIISRDAS